MSSESPVHTPLFRVGSTPITPIPKKRSQTSMKARPVLAVGTPSHPLSFLEKQHSFTKVTSAIHPAITPSTGQNFPEGLSPIGRHSRTPSNHSRYIYTRGPTTMLMDDHSKSDFSGMLDLSATKYNKTEHHISTIEEGGYIMLTQIPKPINFRTRKLQASPTKELDKSHSRIMKQPKAHSIVELNAKELAEVQSSLERPLKQMKQEIKRYIERIRILGIADSRKIKEAGYNEGRREAAMMSRRHACNVMGLTEEEREKMNALNEEDQDFFKKMEAVLIDCLKRMEREDRLSQEVEFQEGKWISMETDRLEWRYCYIDVRGKTPPLKLTVKTGKDVKSLKIVASRRNRKPHKLNCDYEFEDKRFVKIYEKDRKATAFEYPSYYIAICPDESGFMSIRASFGEVEMMERKPEGEKKSLAIVERSRSTMKNESWKAVMSQLTQVQMDEFTKEVKDIKRYFRAKQLLLSGGVDRVAQNKHTEQYTPESVTHLRGERTIKLQEMMSMATQKKMELQEQKHERGTAISKRRDVQKALRDIMRENERQKNHKILIEKNWIVTVAFYPMMKKISQLLAARRNYHDVNNRKMSIVTRMVRKIQQKQLAKGDNFDERLTLDIRYALQFSCLWSDANAIREAEENMVVQFILDYREACTIQSKFEAVIETIKKLQRTWREYARKKEGFKDLLVILWQKNYENVFQKIIAGEHNFNLIRLPNAKSVFKKLVVKELKGDELAREKFVDNYLMANRARYMKSYDNYDQHMSTVDKKDRKKSQILEMLKAGTKAFSASKPRNTAQGRTRMSIMAEIEQNSVRYTESEAPSMIIPGKPPKLFVLPEQEELETLLAKTMVNQAIVSLHRGGIVNIPVKKS